MKISFTSFHFEMYKKNLFSKTLTKPFPCLLTFMAKDEKKAPILCCLLIRSVFPLRVPSSSGSQDLPCADSF